MKRKTLPLWKHQKQAVEKAKYTPNLALFFEPGTGKTRTICEILSHDFDKKIEPTIILCPLVVIQNWRRELLDYTDFDPDRIVTLTGTCLEKEKRLKRSEKFFGQNWIAITNYETVTMTEFWGKVIETLEPKYAIFDESHKIKDIKARRTKECIKFAGNCRRRFLLTGTPVLNTPMDLFSQYLAMDGGETFGENFYGFRAKYFYDKNTGMPAHIRFPNWVIREGSMEAITAKMEKTSVLAKKSECLDLPPLIKMRYEAPLSGAQKRVYDDMKKDLVAYINDKACIAQLALTKALRLQQIVTGFVTMEDGSIQELGSLERNNLLEELLSSLTLNSKVIVWAVFKENYKTIGRICEKLKLKYVEVHGEKTGPEKQRAVDAFNLDDDYKVYIGHPGSGGIGINLTVASYMIYYSRNFSLEQDIQSEARNYRGGSEVHEKITRIDIVSPDTIDDLVLNRLLQKQVLGEALLQDLRKL